MESTAMSPRSIAWLVLLTPLTWSPAAVGQDSKGEAPALKPVPPPYATAHDKPLDGKQEVVNEADDHTQLRVEFNGVKGDRVPAYLYVPKRKAGAGPLPAVL